MILVIRGQPWQSVCSAGFMYSADADGCGRMRTDADGCGRMRTDADGCGRMRTDADGCGRMRTDADGADGRGRMRTDADILFLMYLFDFLWRFFCGIHRSTGPNWSDTQSQTAWVPPTPHASWSNITALSKAIRVHVHDYSHQSR